MIVISPFPPPPSLPLPLPGGPITRSRAGCASTMSTSNCKCVTFASPAPGYPSLPILSLSLSLSASPSSSPRAPRAGRGAGGGRFAPAARAEGPLRVRAGGRFAARPRRALRCGGLCGGGWAEQPTARRRRGCSTASRKSLFCARLSEALAQPCCVGGSAGPPGGPGAGSPTPGPGGVPSAAGCPRRRCVTPACPARSAGRSELRARFGRGSRTLAKGPMVQWSMGPRSLQGSQLDAVKQGVTPTE